ncbi:hypothetical protein D081_1984 [Anaerovibrio sp. JC8]|uniref:helix-turn-helix domain-containing protein n=1 Tax=Anaerovibrio sp. JC8 TaxID=1240085 RepID=UPI000A0ADB20|nr:helix-turn-helix transcriptional regulator [Anaerovibrio sp. JC8]ORT99432.1 hypothetical protein D081_1984 [Anaerovibrio sp. JC8]
MQSFGEKLKSLRVDVKRLTLAEAAKQLGVSKSNVNNWERGIAKPSLEMLCKLASFYNCTVDYLTGYERKSSHAKAMAIFENLPEEYQDHIAAIIEDYNNMVNDKA